MDYSILTKDEIIDGIKNDTIKLKNLSEELRDNKEIMLEAMRQKGSLYYVSDRLKDDYEIVLESVKNNNQSLYYASKRLLDNKDIVLEAVKKDGMSLRIASERLQNDRDFVLEVVKNNGLLLKHRSQALQDDKEFLEVLEKEDISSWYEHNKEWYKERMDFLNSLREKEFIENSITESNKIAKKIKF